MLKFKFILFISFPVLFIMVTSCSKKDETPPVITITAPIEGSVIKLDSAWVLKGVVTDDTKLKEIRIGNDFSITTFNSATRHELNENFNFTSNQQPGNIKIDITATDEAGNSSVKSFNIKVE
ncbi:MAG: hypothetical protein IPM42_07345 [Saprospiraceae bacterium]|nr:hypothetical protein [Saprospiraceae bacterium]